MFIVNSVHCIRVYAILYRVFGSHYMKNNNNNKWMNRIILFVIGKISIIQLLLCVWNMYLLFRSNSLACIVSRGPFYWEKESGCKHFSISPNLLICTTLRRWNIYCKHTHWHLARRMDRLKKKHKRFFHFSNVSSSLFACVIFIVIKISAWVNYLFREIRTNVEHFSWHTNTPILTTQRRHLLHFVSESNQI